MKKLMTQYVAQTVVLKVSTEELRTILNKTFGGSEVGANAEFRLEDDELIIEFTVAKDQEAREENFELNSKTKWVPTMEDEDEHEH